MRQEFYYDIVCPYAYMAFTVLSRTGLFASRKLTLKPILLGGLFKEMSVATDPNLVMSPLRKDYVRRDVLRQAEYFDVPLTFPSGHPQSTVEIMRILTACSIDRRYQLSERFYQAYWRDKIDMSDVAWLDQLKKEFSIDENMLDAAKENLRTATREAFEQKIFGVPTVMLGDKKYFGADRLELIEKDLGLNLNHRPWKKCAPIDFYFDFSSPYSYLAFGEVKSAIAAGAQFNFKPILLGALFKEVGTTNIPMLAAHPNKAKYYLQDMHDWAAHRHMAFRFNDRFPLRSVTPLRIALADPRVIDAIFLAAWADNLDIGDDVLLKSVLDKAGFAKDNLLERAHDDRIKNQLKENTAEALSRGVFGVPTFFVGDEKIFGQDRFLWMKTKI